MVVGWWFEGEESEESEEEGPKCEGGGSVSTLHMEADWDRGSSCESTCGGLEL